ncbi:hypothetical protein CBS101457_000873 [Exobasidium rhododendri]|nr:hypothetical protein CBS101457_000873 [Exobasidium rhododendri]
MSSSAPPTEIEISPAPSSSVNVWNQIKTLSPLQSAKRLGDGKVACSRNSLLLGMGTAAAVSTVGAIAGRGESRKRKNDDDLKNRRELAELQNVKNSRDEEDDNCH